MKKMVISTLFLGVVFASNAQWTSTDDNTTIGNIRAKSFLTDNFVLSYGNASPNWIDKNHLKDKAFIYTSSASKGMFFSAYGVGADIRFQTGGTWLDKPSTSFILANNGNVGIGTTSTTGKLTIKNKSENSNGKGTIGLLGDGNASLRLGVNNDYSWVQSHGSRPLYINELGNNVILNKNAGNVGIGTTIPKAKLHVEGTGYIATKVVGTTAADLHLGVKDKDQLILRRDNNDAHFFFINNTGGVKQGNVLALGSNGDVGIGTRDTKGFKLGVNGKIAATEVKVATYANWPDFVFKESHNLPTLKEVENHIKEKGYLENIPSAEEVKKDGFFLGEMDAKLLQKIEELTLYTIQQEKDLEKQETKIKSQDGKVENLEKENRELKDRLDKIEELLKKLK